MQTLDAKKKELGAEQQEVSAQLDRQAENHAKEMAEQQKIFEQTRKRLTDELENLRAKTDETQMKSNVQIQELSSELKSLKTDYEATLALKEKFEQKTKDMDSERLEIVQQSEERFKAQI